MQPTNMQSRWSMLKRFNWIRPRLIHRNNSGINPGRGDNRAMKPRLSSEELDARLKFVVGCVLSGVLLITTIFILYALVFVTQPIGVQSENDKMFFGVLSSVATFITGTLAGLMISTGRNKQSETTVPEQKENTK